MVGRAADVDGVVGTEPLVVVGVLERGTESLDARGLGRLDARPAFRAGGLQGAPPLSLDGLKAIAAMLATERRDLVTQIKHHSGAELLAELIPERLYTPL